MRFFRYLFPLPSMPRLRLIALVLTLLGKWQWDQPGGYVLAFLLRFGSGLVDELVAKKMNIKAYGPLTSPGQ
jgi:hypothetical protein